MLNTSGGFATLVESILKVFSVVMPALVALALVLFFIGIIKYIRHEGEHKNRDIIVWSLIAMFVLISMWGILGLMCRSVTGSSTCQTHSGGGGFNNQLRM
jgi:hypothetical protein